MDNEYNENQYQTQEWNEGQDEMNFQYPGPMEYFNEGPNMNYQGGYREGYGYGPPWFNQGPRGPYFGGPRSSGPFTWGRGFGPGGPPMPQRGPRENKAITFLLRCGVSRDNLKSVPNRFLHLISAESCGVCSLNFEHINQARSHYISRNHMKNQKKWLAHLTKLGGQHPKEMPLKSRELYCELCDIEITSHAHADSHYAGKIHRAIVEGRKKVKNPYLLQRGMQDRIKQLIRREKKFLKNLEPVQDGDIETKSNQLDLFCSICKTSVTCTEQMTSHLNGKKHLAKEKQHILKMMTGEKTDADVPKKDEEQKDDADESDQEENIEGGKGALEGEHCEEKKVPEENKETAETFDWGNGSGTWDETDAY